jgi:hypothetical protein
VATNIADLPITTRKIVNVVDPKLSKQMVDFGVRIGAVASGYPTLTDWHPVIPAGWGTFPAADFEYALAYRGNAEAWAYSHHQTVTRYKDTYALAWSNGLLHEDYVGQEVHIASSADAKQWSEPGVVAPTPVETRLVRNNAGLYATPDGRLLSYVGVAKDFGRDVSPPGMSVLKEQHIHLDCYETTDLKTWKQYEKICPNVYLFEGPRPRIGRVQRESADLGRPECGHRAAARGHYSAFGRGDAGTGDLVPD